MTDFGNHSPRRYLVDQNGRRVLVGLSTREISEFENLDGLPPLGERGNRVAWDENGIPSTLRENRWLELYVKHDAAWRQWMIETCPNRTESLRFINLDGVT
jgi:hypothetical protein